MYKAEWRGDLVAVKKIRESDASSSEEVKALQENFQRETFLLRFVQHHFFLLRLPDPHLRSQMRHANIVLLMAGTVYKLPLPEYPKPHTLTHITACTQSPNLAIVTELMDGVRWTLLRILS